MFNLLTRGVLRDEAAGGEGGGTGAQGASAGATFDAAAFETKITGTFQSMFNKFDKTLKDHGKTITSLQDQLKAANAGNGSGNGSGEGNGEGTAAGVKALPPEVATRMKQLETKLDEAAKKIEVTEARAQAAENEKREVGRVTAIKDALNAIPFRDQTTREDAFHMVSNRVRYNDDGELIASVDGTDITAKSFIETYFNDKNRLHYLAAKGTSGSGARAAGTGGAGGFNPALMSNLDPGNWSKLTPEQQKATTEYTLSQLKISQ